MSDASKLAAAPMCGLVDVLTGEFICTLPDNDGHTWHRFEPAWRVLNEIRDAKHDQ